MYGLISESGAEFGFGYPLKAEAFALAQEIANDRGESVEVCEYDPDVRDVWPAGVMVEPVDVPAPAPA